MTLKHSTSHCDTWKPVCLAAQVCPQCGEILQITQLSEQEPLYDVAVTKEAGSQTPLLWTRTSSNINPTSDSREAVAHTPQPLISPVDFPHNYRAPVTTAWLLHKFLFPTWKALTWRCYLTYEKLTGISDLKLLNTGQWLKLRYFKYLCRNILFSAHVGACMKPEDNLWVPEIKLQLSGLTPNAIPSAQ